MEVEAEAGTKVRAFNFNDAREVTVPHPAGIGVASISFDNDNEANVEPATTVLRFRFSGPLQPECIYDFDITSSILQLRKQDPAIRWFDRNKYGMDRLEAIASDGETVPITIVYRKDVRRPTGNPTLIVGYGAYGLSTHPNFTPSVVSLLDRGFIHAIAHVRGGREKGIADIGQAVYLRNATRSLISSLRPRGSLRKAMPIGRLCLRKAAAPVVLLWVCWLICARSFMPGWWRKCLS